MHSIAINNDNGEMLLKNSSTPTRPNLSINTNLKKKKWNHIFSSREKTKFDDRSPTKEKKRTSLPTPPLSLHPQTESPVSSTRSSMEHFDTLTALSSTEEKEKPKSIDNISVHSNNSVHSVLKKFHMPHFHIRTNSHHGSPSPSSAASAASAASGAISYVPVAPEPIMPQLVNWSLEAPISPPPWELQQHHSEDIHHNRNKRHSMGFHNFILTSSIFDRVYEEEEDDSITTLDSTTAVDYHSDSEVGVHNNNHSNNKLNNHTSGLSPTNSIGRASDVTLMGSTLSADSSGGGSTIRRRSSCPNYDSLSMSSTSTSSTSNTLVDNDIISITEQHTRHMSVFKKYTHPADKKPALKACQKAKARAAEAAANGTVVTQSNSFYSSFCEDSLKYLYIPNVFDPVTREPILEFSVIKPRKYQLHRKASWKREAKALMTWHHALEEKIRKPTKAETPLEMSPDKVERYELTRKFILREFFVTEVNFWNQLYYSKVIFYDAIVNALANNNQFIKEGDVDPFVNLFDLMQFSAKLINRLRHLQIDHVNGIATPIIPSADNPDPCPKVKCNNARLGQHIRNMSEELVVFLRCALDYKENRKLCDSNANNKGYIMYSQKLYSRKETSQFTMKDYLIIPIQRVARYGLLITDLIKHTESTHPDYKDLVMAHNIVTSLAYAMDSVQKKNKA